MQWMQTKQSKKYYEKDIQNFKHIRNDKQSNNTRLVLSQTFNVYALCVCVYVCKSNQIVFERTNLNIVKY